jgi:Fe-S-cluster containining protein
VVEPLAFRCTGCGNCCRSLRVAVTAKDVARLVESTGLAPASLVAWLAPDEVDMTGEPESFVELREGRRLMVLAQRADACVLLDADARCRAYAARPRDCRAYPFAFEQETADRRRLTLLPLAGCDYAEDGENDLLALIREDEDRWAELAAYQRFVAGWNRAVWHRRRLGKRLPGASDFLETCLTRLEEASPPTF